MEDIKTKVYNKNGSKVKEWEYSINKNIYYLNSLNLFNPFYKEEDFNIINRYNKEWDLYIDIKELGVNSLIKLFYID